jgi:hypothetical protein
MNRTFPRKAHLFRIGAVVLSLLLLVGYASSAQADAQTPITAYDIPAGTEPQIDGIIGEAEWLVAGEWTEVQLYKEGTTTPAFKIDVKFCHNDTYLFIAATYTNTTADNTRFFLFFEVNQSDTSPPNGTPELDDYYDIAISTNGTYSGLATDYWAHVDPPRNDTSTLGSNDAMDVVTESAGEWSVEISKKLDSGDTNGWDIALGEGNTISIAFRVEFDAGGDSPDSAAGQADEWNVLTIGGAIFPEFPVESSSVFIVGTILAVLVFVVIKKRKE